MKEKKLLTLIGSLCLILVLAVLPFMAACPAPAPPEEVTPTPPEEEKPEAPTPIVLKGVSSMPTFVTVVHFVGVFADRVTERSNGELVLDWVGGPEVISQFDLDDRLVDGLVDFGGVIGDFYVDRIPEMRSLLLSKLTNQEERESGYFDFISELHMQNGLVYLARIETTSLYFWLTKRITRPQDFKGLKIGSSATFNDFLLALGGVPTPIEDDYTAMQQGVIDGTGGGGSIARGVSSSWYEVAPYVIEHPFGKGTVVLLMSLETWNELTPQQQDLIKQVAIECEEEQVAFFADADVEARPTITDAGGEFIKFSPEDAEWYLDQFYSSKWEALKETVDAATYAKLRELLKED